MRSVEQSRARGRAPVRELVLDAARATVLDQGWRAVRMGALATEVGLSRQTVHLEFGTKADLGSALVRREIDGLLADISTALHAHPGDPLASFRDAAAVTLTSMAANPLLQIIIGGEGDQDLLALLTSRGAWVLSGAHQMLEEWAATSLADLDPVRVEAMVEPVVRLTLSHGVTPTLPIPDAVASIVRVACLLIGLPDPGPDAPSTPST